MNNGRFNNDPDVIRIVQAISKAATKAFSSPENFRFAKASPVNLQLGRHDGESWGSTLVLRFSNVPRPRNIRQGVVFGSSRSDCDVILNPNTTSNTLSGNHFAITWHHKRPDPEVLVIHHLGDKTKTRVGTKVLSKIKFTEPLFFGPAGTFVQAGFVSFLVFIPERNKSASQIYNKKWRELFLAADPWKPREQQMEDEDALREPTRFHLPSARAWAAENFSPEALYEHPGNQIIGALGGGRYGVVSKCVLHSTGATVAVKQGKTDDRSDEQQMEAAIEFLHQEVDLLRSLQHPQIVRYKHFMFAPPDDINIFMELAPHGDLRTFMDFHEANILDLDEVVGVAKQILEALSYLSREKVTHRDLNPSNILVFHDDPLRVKLGDFGFARSSLNGGNHARKTGTLAYCAPEILDPSSEIKGGDASVYYHHHACDMFFLGVTLWELSVGQNPLPESDDHVQVRAALRKLKFQTLRRYTSVLAGQLIWLMISEYPEYRPDAESCLTYDPWIRTTVESGTQEMAAGINRHESSADQDQIMPPNAPALASVVNPASTSAFEGHIRDANLPTSTHNLHDFPCFRGKKRPHEAVVIYEDKENDELPPACKKHHWWLPEPAPS